MNDIEEFGVDVTEDYAQFTLESVKSFCASLDEAVRGDADTNQVVEVGDG